MNNRSWLAIEGLLVVLSIAAALFAADVALQRALDQSALREGVLFRSANDVADARNIALAAFAAGAFSLFVGSAVGRWNAGSQAIPIPLLFPATILAAGLGLALQMGYGDPLRGPGWPGPNFAGGVMIGGLVGGLVLAVPWDWGELFHRTRHVLLAGILIAFAALTLFGSGPTGSGTRINLGPFQPLEIVKLSFVAYVAVFLGRRAASLRYQRNYLFGGLLRVPRPRLLFPATLVLLGLFLGLFLVRDLGPILILGLTFLILFTVVTRSVPWAVFALGMVVLVVGFLASAPDAVGSEALALRMRMWLDPWTNALPNGDQLAASRWAIAAGGLTGQGFGAAAIGALPAGQTDLVLAHLAEELGFGGVVLYLVLLATVVTQGMWVALTNRTPERVLLATGLCALLACQWLVIFGGTTGLLPLTGVIVPFLSAGRTSMVSFLVVVALIGALARDGQARAYTDELEQLRGGVIGVAATVALLLLGAVGVMFAEGVILGPSTSTAGVITTLGDGTVVHRHDRRMEAIAAGVPRGELRDRHGAVLAGNDEEGARVTPLGDGLGTLLGPVDDVVLRPSWSLEREFDEQLRGYGHRPDGPSAWLAKDDSGKERALFATPTRDERPRDRRRAERLADGDAIRQLPLPAPDYRKLVPVLHTAPEERPAKIAELLGTVDDRSVRLTLDAKLQELAASTLKDAAAKGKAAAAVVIDVDSGEVLVRAQVPDIDPSDPGAWLPQVRASDPAFVGVYGAWSDMTTHRGIFQAGSIGKILTAVAAVREDYDSVGRGCDVRTRKRFECVTPSARGPRFTMPDWRSPVHDYYKDDVHGRIDLAEAIAESCNVTFAQIALDLGPEAFRAVVRDGLQTGWSDRFRPGEVDSRTLAETGFGQGATAMSVSQAARMAAMVAAGGTYRTCPSTLEYAAPCQEIRVVDDEDALNVVLAGMRGTMTRGTASANRKIDGVRIYGKTGTADSIGLRDEEPYGLEFKKTGYRPHSWFIAIAEDEEMSACSAAQPGRLAIAVVVPRAGTGASVAAPAALKILAGARQLGYLGGDPS
ncbi:MAG: FtsW/RodA/SpoVE family cell cycle protein [Myxococcales bacterium]|nr:FtsW/RodA/SpoVE family cell cycle protein [Myxococcales bacterium]